MAQITGGEAFNPELIVPPNTSLGLRFEDEDPETGNSGAEITVPPSGNNPPANADGRFFAVNVRENGVNPGLRSFDTGYFATIGDGVALGSSGAFLLARVDYSIIGPGTTTFDLFLDLDTVAPVILLDSNVEGGTILLDPTLGSASLTVTGIPEPSSLTLLILGSVGMLARRKRA